MTRAAWILVALCAMGCERLGASEPARAPATDEVVCVDWLGRGQLYAAKVTGHADELVGVEYADGDREWVEPARMRPWPELRGRRIQIWIRHAAQDVTVIDRRGGLFHVRFDDGADTWVSSDMLYALEARPVEPPRPPPPPPPSFPVRAAAPASEVRPGAFALAYWMEGEGVRRSQPWVVQILSVDGAGAHVRFLSDGSEQTLAVQHVLRVFDAHAHVGVGQRAWLAEGAPVGLVREERAGLVKVMIGTEERWLDADRVLAPAPAIDPARLAPGALVTALWSGSALYHATVQRIDGESITLAWHDGSTPSAVPRTDVIEVWSASE